MSSITPAPSGAPAGSSCVCRCICEAYFAEALTPIGDGALTSAFVNCARHATAGKTRSRHEGPPMATAPLFKAAFPYQKDVLALPVLDLHAASQWYSRAFGLKEVERRKQPQPAVILERDGVKLGFEINGGDASQDGAAILVSDIHRAKAELEANGIKIGNWRVDERNGQKFQVFFVVAPDGLCFYFHQPL
jgi:catechol 2,3-dioxygenase-like lactoylglutathione lyase family enzyme